MKILNTNSLSTTIDNLNQTYYDNKNLNKLEKTKIARWIASRQGLEGSYWGMFAPTEKDFKGIKLFTGETVNTGAGVSHILGEEALRSLTMLNVKETNKAFNNAKNGLQKAIKRAQKLGYYEKGIYCCGKCSVAYWRNLSSENTDKNNSVLKSGIKNLKKYRDGKGKWRRFPFYYTLLALSNINLPEAKEELQYASVICERLARTMRKTGKYGKRRFDLIQKVLEMI